MIVVTGVLLVALAAQLLPIQISSLLEAWLAIESQLSLQV